MLTTSEAAKIQNPTQLVSSRLAYMWLSHPDEERIDEHPDSQREAELFDGRIVVEDEAGEDRAHEVGESSLHRVMSGEIWDA
jgi:hypothetical protein